MAKPTAKQIDSAIFDLLAQRDEGKTICPSDAARALAGDQDFRPLMDPVRDRAYTLRERGELQITQKGKPVDPATARGPIRLRLPAR